MRNSVVCLAAALAICLVLPLCSARPGELCGKKKLVKSACAGSCAGSALSGRIIKKGGCGCGGGCGGGCGCGKKAARMVVSKPCGGKIPRPITKAIGCTLLNEGQIRQKYARLSGEGLDVYFKRIVCRTYDWTSTTDAYLKTLTLVWKDFSTLDLWYDRKYITYSKEFFSLYYAQQPSESYESYYSRIVKREVWETDDLFARRITIVRDCFPSLDLWVSDKWFDKYTRSIYALEFKRFAEESEVDYINRIFERDSYFDLSDEIWAKRVFLIQEATISNCNLWYNEAYFPTFKRFYSLYYKKLSTETSEAWLLRALSPLPGESLDLGIKRIKFIKDVTGDCGCWKLDYFKKIQQAKSLQEPWLVKIKSAFFPCGCGR